MEILGPHQLQIFVNALVLGGGFVILREFLKGNRQELGKLAMGPNLWRDADDERTPFRQYSRVVLARKVEIGPAKAATGQIAPERPITTVTAPQAAGRSREHQPESALAPKAAERANSAIAVDPATQEMESAATSAAQLAAFTFCLSPNRPPWSLRNPIRATTLGGRLFSRIPPVKPMP